MEHDISVVDRNVGVTVIVVGDPVLRLVAFVELVKRQVDIVELIKFVPVTAIGVSLPAIDAKVGLTREMVGDGTYSKTPVDTGSEK